MTDSKKSLLSFKEYVPILYIILVCLGYFTKNFYYEKFDIEILNYLSIQEFVLMFIPAGSIIVTVVLFLIMLLAPYLLFADTTDLESQRQQEENLLESWIDNIGNEKLKWLSNKVYWICALITSIYLFFVPLLLFGYLALTRFVHNLKFDSRIVIPAIVVWGLLFVFKFRLKSSKYKRNPRVVLFVYFIAILVCYVIYIDIELSRAKSILNGNPEYLVEFETGKENIKSDNRLVYFGETNAYLFLRELSTEKNHIYEKGKIDNLRITKRKK